MVFCRIVGLLVDPHDKGAVDALSGGGDDDLLRAGVDVRGHFGFFPEFARRLQYDVDAEFLPGQQRAIVRDVGDPDLLAVDDKGLVGAGDFSREFPVDGVILEKVGEDGRFALELTATISMSSYPRAALTRYLPTRPKPFTAHLTPMCLPPVRIEAPV